MLQSIVLQGCNGLTPMLDGGVCGQFGHGTATVWAWRDGDVSWWGWENGGGCPVVVATGELHGRWGDGWKGKGGLWSFDRLSSGSFFLFFFIGDIGFVHLVVQFHAVMLQAPLVYLSVNIYFVILQAQYRNSSQTLHWLIDQVIIIIADRRIARLIDWLIDFSIACSIGWLIDSMTSLKMKLSSL